MFPPEYRKSFSVLRKEIGIGSTLKIIFFSALKSRNICFPVDEDYDEAEKRKIILKNHFKLLTQMYKELQNRYGIQRANEIIHEVLIQSGPVFMRGFSPLPSNGTLIDFIPIYKNFESNNLIFETIEESNHRFEIVIHRCLIYEAFKELGLEEITKWMCDIAFLYFNDYHPQLKYTKDLMIARGDDVCHEIFVWEGSN